MAAKLGEASPRYIPSKETLELKGIYRGKKPFKTSSFSLYSSCVVS